MARLERERERESGLAPRIVVFATYQSIDVIITAQNGTHASPTSLKFFEFCTGFRRPFKLIINDEAHRTAGFQKIDSVSNEKKEISVWQKTHDDTLLNATYRLYMTATPRIYGESAKQKTKDSQVLLFSMDDEEVFGQEVYHLRFDEAIKRGLLCDYRVLISFMSEEFLASFINQKTKAQEKSALALEDAGKMVGVYNALRKENMYLIGASGELEPAFRDDRAPMKRAIAFHSSIKNSKFVQKHFASIDSELKNKEIIEHIDGKDNATQKAQKLHWLADEDPDTPFKILSNAKCLTEGIDVPSLDAVAFFNPRDSVVDIVQAVGRAMRKAPDKKYGYIILPIVLSDEEIKNYDETLKGGKFKCVWQVLKALRSHDERLVDEARINEVLSPMTSSYDQIEMPDVGLFSLSDLINEMKNAVPKHLGDLEYWEAYATKVGEIIHKLILRIESLLAQNPQTSALFENFCQALRANINASFETKEAITLIAQHITLQPIFDSIFPNIKFSEFDKVSLELTKLYENLLTFGLDSETRELEKFYESIRASANRSADIAQSDKSRQNLIKNLYDTLFKSAFKKTQEKLGIVYTPLEVVDFIIASVSYALSKHFGKALSDSDVHICDPFTGTGTFITRLIQSGLLDSNLAYKYKHELWANEITLLAYYIAQINITSTYHERLSLLNSGNSSLAQGHSALRSSARDSHNSHLAYTLFDNLLFTDTFNTYTPESKGFIGEKKNPTLFDGDYLAHNYAKIQEFKQAPFKIIIGNPPYSVGQKNANDNNKNISYPYLESRIKKTYVARTNAQKFKYDSYKMAIRYASDRIESSGIIGFVTNGSFIDRISDSGLRACLEEEFDYVYVFNLRGDIQKAKQNKNSGEGENIFGESSSTSVAISIFIKIATHYPKKAQIFYYDIGENLSTQEKLNNIQHFKSIESIPFTHITPNKDYDWINQRDYSFYDYMPLGHNDTKLKNLPLTKSTPKTDPQVLQEDYVDIFEIYSQGILTARDKWCVNFSKQNLESNMRYMIENYNAEVAKYEIDSTCEILMDKTKINWSDNLTNDLKKHIRHTFDNARIVFVHYRPFTKCHLYLDKAFNERLCQIPQIYPTPQTQDIEILGLSAQEQAEIKEFLQTYKYLPNLTICVNTDSRCKFGVLINNGIPDLSYTPASQCFPLYYYEHIESSQAQKTIGTQTSIDDFAQESQATPLSSEGTANHTGRNLDLSQKDKPTLYYKRKDAIRDEALARFQEIYKRFWNQNPQYAIKKPSSRRQDFGDKIGVLECEARELPKAVMTEAKHEQSPILAQKTTPITKEHIFYYIYAVLNHPEYKEKYKDNLSKMLPRIPFVKDFWGFESIGRKLAQLHLNYEGYASECDELKCFACLSKQASDLAQAIANPSLLTQDIDVRTYAQNGLQSLSDEDFKIQKLSFGKDKKKAQDKSMIVFNDHIHIINIPLKAYEYVVNGKSAIEWIMNRYQITTDEASLITNDPNLYESQEGALKGLKGGRYVLELLKSVIAMSVKSVDLISAMPALEILD